MSDFINLQNEGYNFEGGSITFGKAKLDGETIKEVPVKIPLKTLSRHGLIAGATGTGKTKTLQKFAEQLSVNGIPSLVMDIKGDLSGLAVPSEGHPKIDERMADLGMEWSAKKLPIEFLTISEQDGTKVRATVIEFGPILFSKILDLNETQTGVVSLIFKYCDDNKLPLLNLADFKKTLQYLTNEGKEEIEKDYGSISSSSTSAIMRKVIGLEQEGGEGLFGERSFDVSDLTRYNQDGYGYVNIMRLDDIQGKPKLFSTFMLCLLAEVYSIFPEEGELEKPKLCIFIDEAHLIFDNASKALIEQLEMIVKLIRSKGVGVYFVTQNPQDIPQAVLGQLGMKIQHALRAFTAKDAEDIKKTAKNYPISEFYNIEETLTSLGIGQALFTCLNEKGIPTPLVACKIGAPETRMDVITDQEKSQIINSSSIYQKYKEDLDPQSAYEILNKKIEDFQKLEADEEKKKVKDGSSPKTGSKSKKDDSFLGGLSKNTMVRQVGRAVAKEVTRGLLGVFGLK